MSVDKILEQRQKVHGEFRDHASISQGLKEIVRSGRNWAKLEPYQKEAIDMCFHKIARILDGNRDYIDSWRDAAAYIELATRELGKKDGALDSIVSYKINNGGDWQSLKDTK